MPLTPINRRQAIATGAALAAAAVAPAALAQAAWPSRPLKIVVGFPGGSSPDLMARTLADPLQGLLGQPVVIENRPGAGGNVAAAQVARADDDHTIGLMINGNMTIAKILNPATTYDPLTDLTPVSLIAVAPLLLAGAPGTPTDPRAFLEAARSNGDKWNYGTPGIGTVAHLGMELLKSRAGLGAVHVPYPGNPQVMAAMVGGQIQMSLLPPGLAMAQVRAGKLHAIGVTSAGRSAVVPDVPSLAEAGVKDFSLEIWNAVAAPNSLPKAHVNRLATLLTEIVRRPDVREKILNQGWAVAGTSPEGLARRIKADTAAMADVIKRNNIRPS
ncbi:MAG: tripartite tricarboxylate transporter substrate binding protein [Hydrogenophaga sp.]|uniref:Bug family tripartite tricarboxylate transporter substrate binding protein n=1 Tax=Hydrogenophaga sp. TaxID=1904254 RepID=UPI0016AAE91E|nr:tripartite tricarboxylate transporter substrate binding protein [Hydrogenophaga sp.]NIM42164.1 tripartite tricarboxylate transporter substrate binding protein [Hydrogenophaga sp.]NIN27457.1 tripartite tricarboxylate transporter substrate binding protein [Hydrogenophaga sp.]NIN32158.1 tripartite tricarboxylate transporter substrate binding protein [Hydrogenophaga sp.]NIN56410.1 tripartite tricarboxylate transporter substrate binding protein [Hydrogenophaga sp.]NIO52717.1 tripartite tricarbox